MSAALGHALTVRIDAHQYPVIDLSYHGARIATRGAIVPVSRVVTVDFVIPGQDIPSCRATASVAWSGKNETALAFETPGATWPEIEAILGHAAQNRPSQPAIPRQ